MRAGLLVLLSIGLGCRSKVDVQADPATKGASDARGPSLEGLWVADKSGRRLSARANGPVWEFHVVDPTEWSGAYVADEVRFTLTPIGDGYQVVDRYRPKPDDTTVYGEAGRKACLVELANTAEGQPLRAKLQPDSGLSVQFDEVKMTLITGASALEIENCKDVTVVRVLDLGLHRKS